ncbi:MAG: phosphatidylinositol-3-phosphatase [Actinomycetota bacterium]|nr:phosphatidylinositol-3-phosphatase [Actinomycetota bacterium]
MCLVASFDAAAAADPGASQQRAFDGVPALGNVFVIIGENTSRTQLSTRMTPYLVGTVRPNSAWVTNYWSLPATSSLPNYIGLTSGRFTRCDTHNLAPRYCHHKSNNLFHQLSSHGLSWHLWAESAARRCDFRDRGSTSGWDHYVVHHIPALYYDSVTNGVTSNAQPAPKACRDHVVPAGTTGRSNTDSLDKALASGTVPRLNFIVPNQCDNGHDRCGSASRLKQFDNFVRREAPKILSSPAFGSRSVLIVTYDEGEASGYPNRRNVAMAVMGPLVQTGRYSDGANWTHYSLLRTLEDGFRLGWLGAARDARPLGVIWR